MVQTVIINDTSGDLYLKEGNAGVYRDIKKLVSKHVPEHVIKIDPNATYREYVFINDNSGGEKLVVCSDDCIEICKSIAKAVDELQDSSGEMIRGLGQLSSNRRHRSASKFECTMLVTILFAVLFVLFVVLTHQ